MTFLKAHLEVFVISAVNLDFGDGLSKDVGIVLGVDDLELRQIGEGLVEVLHP